MAATIRKLFGSERGRHPQPHVAAKKLKARGHHADDCVLLAIEEDVAVDDLRIAAVARLPEPVTQHSHVRCAGTIVVCGEHTANCGRHTQKWKEVCGNGVRRYAFGIAVASQIVGPLHSPGHVCKRLRLCFPVDVICRRRRVARETSERCVFPNDDEPLRIVKLQRLEQHRVYDAENCCVSANSECERKHRHHGKTGTFP